MSEGPVQRREKRTEPWAIETYSFSRWPNQIGSNHATATVKAIEGVSADIDKFGGATMAACSQDLYVIFCIVVEIIFKTQHAASQCCCQYNTALAPRCARFRQCGYFFQDNQTALSGDGGPHCTCSSDSRPTNSGKGETNQGSAAKIV
jgi:hypothetical protein